MTKASIVLISVALASASQALAQEPLPLAQSIVRASTPAGTTTSTGVARSAKA
jgi:hypothetical protein